MKNNPRYLAHTSPSPAHNTCNCYTDTLPVSPPIATNFALDWNEYTPTFALKHYPAGSIVHRNRAARSGDFDRESTVPDPRNSPKAALAA